MTDLLRPALIAVSSLGLMAAPALAQEDEQTADAETELTEGEKELAELLEGRVAGEPQSCIRDFRNTRSRVIDETAIVYGRGRTIYVNRTARPQDLDDHDALVIRRFSGTRLCNLDFVRTIDRTSGIFTGNLFLTDFIPYTLVEEDSASEG